ncbi:hypothetical protein HY489_01260 [Candidatus Woesearchaeota archaeon]|nr:hypothetical protein [Candidatus Woesearchaeota archaeon]
MVFTIRDLAQQFVEGNVQARFTLMGEVIQGFIQRNGPIIEAVNASLSLFEERMIKALSGSAVLNEMRADREKAARVLADYNRTFGRIQHNLAMAASNINLPQFLEANGVEQKYIRQFQPFISEYWTASYGVITEKFFRIQKYLGEMRDLLQQEVDGLAALETDKVIYTEGVDRAAEIRALFKRERDVFWTKLVPETKFSEEEERRVWQKLSVARDRLRATIQGYQTLLKAGFQGNEQAKFDIHRGILAILCVVGAIKMIKEVKKSLVGKPIKAFFGWLSTRNERKLNDLTKNAVDAASDLTADSIASLIPLL